MHLRIPIVALLFAVGPLGAGGRASRDFAPAINERFLGRTAGKTDAQLDAEHQRAMTIAIVANPQFTARWFMKDLEGLRVTNFAGNSRLIEFFLDVNDLAVVG